jgi:hypothetical protein|nr:MAG TPA: hypothetical protein [Caudoviricetes sp.]
MMGGKEREMNVKKCKKPLCAYGKRVKIALMEKNRTQTWLIAEISKKNPDIYLDSSCLHRILTGTIKSGKAIAAINDILGL